eukprot:scaffold7381_cov310-Pinguiococcus_pyrenoidosus.AAC.110
MRPQIPPLQPGEHCLPRATRSPPPPHSCEPMAACRADCTERPNRTLPRPPDAEPPDWWRSPGSGGPRGCERPASPPAPPIRPWASEPDRRSPPSCVAGIGHQMRDCSCGPRHGEQGEDPPFGQRKAHLIPGEGHLNGHGHGELHVRLVATEDVVRQLVEAFSRGFELHLHIFRSPKRGSGGHVVFIPADLVAVERLATGVPAHGARENLVARRLQVVRNRLEDVADLLPRGIQNLLKPRRGQLRQSGLDLPEVRGGGRLLRLPGAPQSLRESRGDLGRAILQAQCRVASHLRKSMHPSSVPQIVSSVPDGFDAFQNLLSLRIVLHQGLDVSLAHSLRERLGHVWGLLQQVQRERLALHQRDVWAAEPPNEALPRSALVLAGAAHPHRHAEARAQHEKRRQEKNAHRGVTQCRRNAACAAQQKLLPALPNSPSLIRL